MIAIWPRLVAKNANHESVWLRFSICANTIGSAAVPDSESRAQVDLHQKVVEVCWAGTPTSAHLDSKVLQSDCKRKCIDPSRQSTGKKWLLPSLNEQQSETCLRREEPQAVIGGDCLVYGASRLLTIGKKEVSEHDLQALGHDAGRHASA